MDRWNTARSLLPVCLLPTPFSICPLERLGEMGKHSLIFYLFRSHREAGDALLVIGIFPCLPLGYCPSPAEETFGSVNYGVYPPWLYVREWGNFCFHSPSANHECNDTVLNIWFVDSLENGGDSTKTLLWPFGT